jgi:hypothetical protein
VSERERRDEGSLLPSLFVFFSKYDFFSLKEKNGKRERKGERKGETTEEKKR